MPILTERACESCFGGSQLAVNQKTWHKDIKKNSHRSLTTNGQQYGERNCATCLATTVKKWKQDTPCTFDLMTAAHIELKKKKDVTHYLLFPYQCGGDFHLIVLLNWVIPPLLTLCILMPAYRDGAALKHSTDCSNCKPPEAQFLCPNMRQP